MKVLVTQLCSTLCNPMDCSPPGFPAHGDSSGKKEYWGGLPCFPGDLPDPGVKPRSHTLQADSLLSEPPGEPEGIAGHVQSKKKTRGESNIWGKGMQYLQKTSEKEPPSRQKLASISHSKEYGLHLGQHKEHEDGAGRQGAKGIHHLQ